MIYDNFFREKELIETDNSIVYVGKDGTCIKKVFLPKCIRRLNNEAECLKILDGFIAPKLIEYDKINYALRMEYIKGKTLPEYVEKYGQIPKYFFAKVAGNLLKLLDFGIGYGGDIKISEHFIIIEETQDVRIIDFGVSDIYRGEKEISFCVDCWTKTYKKEFAFVFNDANAKDVEHSMQNTRYSLRHYGISEDVIDQYFENYDKI